MWDTMMAVELLNQAAGLLYYLDGDGVITAVDIQRVARWWGRAAPQRESAWRGTDWRSQLKPC